MKRISIRTLILLSSVTMLLLSACGVSEPETIDLSAEAVSSYTGSAPAVHMQLKTPGTNTIICQVSNTPANTKPVATGCPEGSYTEQLFDAAWKQIGTNKTVTVSGTTPPTTSRTYTGSAPATHMQLKIPNTNTVVCQVSNTPASTRPVAQNCPSGTYTEQLFGADWKQIGTNKTVTVGSPATPTAPPNPSSAVYSQTFDTVSLGKYKGISDLSVEACAGKGHCLKASYRPNNQGSPRLVYTEPLPAAKEYTLTYDLRFDKNFEWVYGGKLPGLAPSNVSAGCAARVDDAWSARLMWRGNGKLQQYLYSQDKTGCGEEVFADDFTLQKGRWYKVAVYVKVNSSASAKDGQVSLFVDGKEVARRDNLQLRNTSSGGLIEKFLFSSFYGGNDSSWSPSRTTYAYFDNFAVYPGLRSQ